MASVLPSRESVGRFEMEFAAAFGASSAVAYPHGRVALKEFLKAMSIRDAEVILPAYTCTVVAHAVVLSGNRPVFVDINLDDYNMSEEATCSAITERTRVILPTHIFGQPMECDAIRDAARDAGQRYGHRIWVIQDCAHSFAAENSKGMVCSQGDAALFGLNVSKMMTSIFGGMMTTSDDILADTLREHRRRSLRRPGMGVTAKRRAYLLAVAAAFSGPGFSATAWLDQHTTLLHSFTRAYHLDDEICFPPGSDLCMSKVEAAVGRVQLARYRDIVSRRRYVASRYLDEIKPPPGWVMPKRSPGATWSHFPIRVPDRDAIRRRFAGRGIELGEVIQYAVPDVPSYTPYRGPRDCPNARICSKSMINLPIYPDMTDRQVDRVIRAIHEAPA